MINFYGRKYILENNLIDSIKNGDVKCYISERGDSSINQISSQLSFKLKFKYDATLNKEDGIEPFINAAKNDTDDGSFFILLEEEDEETNETKYSSLNDYSKKDGNAGEILIHLLLVPLHKSEAIAINSLGLYIDTETANNYSDYIDANSNSTGKLSSVLFPEYTISSNKQAVFHYYLYF